MMNNATIDTPASIKQSDEISIGYLFCTFLKIGATSFGGHMALMSFVERIVIERDKKVSLDLFYRAISLASLLPGPMAVNAVAFLGFSLKGRTGAVASVVAVLIPAVIIMLTASWLYFDTGYRGELHAYFIFTTGVISATIAAAGYAMYKREITTHAKRAVLIMAFVSMYVLPGYTTTFALIIGSLLMSMVMFIVNGSGNTRPAINAITWQETMLLGCLVLIPACPLFNFESVSTGVYMKLIIVFASLSVSLFGGGYVIIPMMQTLLVNELQWLTTNEFADAIALSQATPGPILVSATFIGYKLAGITGGLLATVSVFAPASILMITIGRLVSRFSDESLVGYAIKGTKPVIIGMVFASAVKLLMSGQPVVLSLVIMLVSLYAMIRWKLSPVYLITIAIVFGVLKQILL